MEDGRIVEEVVDKENNRFVNLKLAKNSNKTKIKLKTEQETIVMAKIEAYNREDTRTAC